MIVAAPAANDAEAFVLATGWMLSDTGLDEQLREREVDDHERYRLLDLAAEIRAEESGPPDTDATDNGRTVDSLRLFAAFQLAADPTACEALLRGESVPRHRLNADVLEKIGEARADELELTDELARRVELRVPKSSRSDAAEHDEPSPHSWQPVDLVALALAAPEPPTISGLAYPERRHLYSGEPESLKSWVALVLCAEQIKAGACVVYVDLEMGRRETLARSRDLGLTDEEISNSLIYLEPSEPLGLDLRADLDRLLAERKPTLIVIDANAGAFGIHGLDGNLTKDVETFYRNVVDPLRAHGAAVIILDHLPKDPAARGRFAIGSERKVGAADVHLGFELIAPFGRGKTGRAKIVTHKDRPGHLPRPKCAELELASDPTTGRITWTLRPVEQTDEQHEFRPTFLMERVSRHVEGCAEPPSRNAVEGAVKGNAAAVRLAIDTLLREGYIAEQEGPRRARLLHSERPYREGDDLTSSTSSDFVPTSSETRSSPLRPLRPSPYGGDNVGVDEVAEVDSADFVQDEDDVEQLAEQAREMGL